MTLLIASAISFWPNVTNGDWREEAYKKEDASVLSYHAGIEDTCPLAKSSLDEIIERVLDRGQIKPDSKSWPHSKLYLLVTVACIPTKYDNPAYNVSIRFGDNSNPAPQLYLEEFGSFGIGHEVDMDDAVRTGVERAIMKFLKANTDPGP